MEVQYTSEMTPYFTITKCNKLFITYLTRSTECLGFGIKGLVPLARVHWIIVSNRVELHRTEHGCSSPSHTYLHPGLVLLTSL